MYGLLRGHLNHLMEGQELMATIEPSQLYGCFHNIVYNSQCNSPNTNYFVCFYLDSGQFLIVSNFFSIKKTNDNVSRRDIRWHLCIAI